MIILLLILLMEALFALTFPLGKMALRYAGVLFLIGMRMTIAGIMLLGYYGVTQAFPRKISRSDCWLLAKTTLFYVYLSFVPEFWALQSMSALKSNILWSSMPFVSALLGYYLLDERLTKYKWAGLIIGLCAMLPVMFMIDSQEAMYGNVFYLSLPDVFMAITVFSAAYGLFLVKELMNKGYDLIFINGITMFFGGLLSFATRWVDVSHPQSYIDFWSMMGYVLLLIFISNIVGYAIYGYLLRFYSITFLSLAGFLCPVFGAVFSKLLLNEPLHYQYAITGVGVLLGLLIFYREELNSKNILK